MVGSTGAKRKAVGEFAVTRTATGTYELSIPGKNASNGTLLLQVADREAGTAEPLASRAFASSQFANGKFTIQTRRTVSDSEAELVDASFYAVWVDFEQPLAMPYGPRMRAIGPVALSTEETVLRETAVAASTHVAEALVVSIDQNNTGGYTDPLSGQLATAAMIGQFVDAKTLALIGERFVILASNVAGITKADVAYNPVSKQYVAVASARSYNVDGKHVPMLALVNPSADTTRVAKVWVHDPETPENYDDVAVAAGASNGNFMLVAERAAAGEGETTIGALYSQTGELLTPVATRVDPFQTLGDEDDPDVIYLPRRDKYFYVSNTDNSNGSTGTLSNRIVGSVLETTPGQGGSLVVRTEQPLGDGQPVRAEGHPASIENPFNGQLITAYDAGNDTSAGDISYFELGTAPAYVFTPAGPEVPYLNGEPGVPFRHQHPQMEADPVSGTLVLTMNARASSVGMPDALAYWVLGPDGRPLPGQLPAPWLLADAPGGISNSANFHGVAYSPAAQSFVMAYSVGAGVVHVAGLQVTSSHLAPAERPSLRVTRSGTGISLGWPASAAGYVLESGTNLGAWTPAGLTPSVVNGENVVTTDAGSGDRYFRLVKP